MTAPTPSRGILAGIAAPIVSWSLSAIVIVTWQGYDPVAQSISLLANAPLGWLQTAAFAASGLLGMAWAFGLATVLGSTARQRALVRGMVLFQAALAIGFAVFPTDPGERGVTTVGAIHLAIFAAYAATMPATLLALGLVMRADPRWQAFARPTLVAAALVTASAALVPATIDGPLTPWLGLLERIYVAIPSVWQIGAGLVARRVTRR